MNREQLDAIQKRVDVARDYASRVHIQESADDVPALLAYARDLEARLGRVEALVDSPDQTLVKPKGDKIFYVEAHRIRAALTATREALK